MEGKLIHRQLSEFLEKLGSPVEVSYSGSGKHAFAAMGDDWPSGRRTHWTLKNANNKPVAGVESFATGGNCYLLVTEQWEHGGPADTLPLIRFDAFQAALHAAEMMLLPRQQDAFRDADWVPDALEFMNPNCSYDDWCKVGMALAGLAGGYDLWNEWSAQGDDYPGPHRDLEKVVLVHARWWRYAGHALVHG